MRLPYTPRMLLETVVFVTTMLVADPIVGVGTPPPIDSVILFDGSDVEAWRAADGAAARWPVRDGVLLVDRNAGDIVSILLNNGDATFSAGMTLALGAPPTYSAIEDLDGDGDRDLVVAAGGAAVLFSCGERRCPGTRRPWPGRWSGGSWSDCRPTR